MVELDKEKLEQQHLDHALRWNEKALPNKLVLEPVFWLIPIMLWTVLVGFSLYHNITEINSFSKDTASNKGRFVFQMIEDMRLWNARHGGVYVDETADTPSNPYLHVKDKDLVTTSGRKLTKVNPAYMTRQLAGIIKENSSTLVNITSLKPINPINAPDQWETTALKSFERGIEEASEFVSIGEIELFRYMAPLITKKACMQCHEHQGYQVGEVRGGISISFDSSLFLQLNQQQKLNQHFLHAAVWLLLTSLTVLALWRLRNQLLTLITINRNQEELVRLRTRDWRAESRKRSETEAQFRRFIEATEEGIVALDNDGLCTFANPKCLQLLQLDKIEDIIGHSFHDICGHSSPKGRIPRQECSILNCIETGQQAHNDQEFFEKKNGEAFAVEYSVSPVFDEDEKIGVILTFRDVSERKRRESELLKLSTAVANSPASTLITDRTGRIEYVNEKFCEITGYSEKELIGKNPRILKSGHTDISVYRNLWETINKGKPWKGELFNRKKDGTLFWEESLISPIKDSYGNISHFVAVKRDITDYKKEMSEVWHQANFDALTRLPNRNLFEDRLENAVALAGREDRLLALLFIDLDGFKAINDDHGHDAGDHVLEKTAHRLQAHLRHSDTAARLGGDEFVIILQDSHSVGDVENVAQKIIDQVAQAITFKEEDLFVSASIGISLMPRDGQDANQLLRNADIAMYGAKQQGKNCFCHYCDVTVCMPNGVDKED